MVAAHAVICHTGAQQAVPGAALQQNVFPPDVDRSWHMVVPAVVRTYCQT